MNVLQLLTKVFCYILLQHVFICPSIHPCLSVQSSIHPSNQLAQHTLLITQTQKYKDIISYFKAFLILFEKTDMHRKNDSKSLVYQRQISTIYDIIVHYIICSKEKYSYNPVTMALILCNFLEHIFK